MHDAENRAAVWALRQALRTSGLTPFAGAGISAPFGFPLWRPFIERCAEHGGVDVTERLRRRQFEQAAEEIVAARGRAWLDRIITRRFGRTPGARRDTAAQLLPRLASGPVLTTNFDTVLETVFRANPYRSITRFGAVSRSLPRALCAAANTCCSRFTATRARPRAACSPAPSTKRATRPARR
jgi:hypothetical protein